MRCYSWRSRLTRALQHSCRETAEAVCLWPSYRSPLIMLVYLADVAKLDVTCLTFRYAQTGPEDYDKSTPKTYCVLVSSAAWFGKETADLERLIVAAQ